MHVCKQKSDDQKRSRLHLGQIAFFDLITTRFFFIFSPKSVDLSYSDLQAPTGTEEQGKISERNFIHSCAIISTHAHEETMPETLHDAF